MVRLDRYHGFNDAWRDAVVSLMLVAWVALSSRPDGIICSDRPGLS